MLTAIVIPADPEQSVRLEQFEKNELGIYRHLVGGNIEVITLGRPPASLYFNEEGKLLNLPINERATAMLWVHNSAFRGEDIIVGDAFIVGPVDNQGDDTTVPDELVQLLFHTERLRVLVQIEGDTKFYSSLAIFGDWFSAYLSAVNAAQNWSQIEEVLVVAERDEERSRLIREWLRIGRENPWIRTAYDPPFSWDSFYECHTLAELEECIGHGNWSLGTAFFYRDLCFIQQDEGGDEWLTIRHGIPFESITCGPFIESGEFASLVRRLLAATREQCQRLEY